MNAKTCIIITGPTAVGKTSIAIRLAKHFNTEIISADSRQCYRELSIGVAKPTEEELKEVHHWFVNSHSIHDNVSAADFEQYALMAVQRIFENHEVAIMVGGTGLYIKAFMEGLDQIPPIDPLVRQQVIRLYEEKGIDFLRETVQQDDPLFGEKGDIDNPQRLMRALEVKWATGKSIRHFQEGSKATRPFNMLTIGLELPRDQLYNQIDIRVDQMIASGLVDEARRLYDYRHLNALQTVGYSELYEHFDGKCTLQEAINKIKQHTRNYAKRQLTWFKKAGINANFSPTDWHKIQSYVEAKLQSANFT